MSTLTKEWLQQTIAELEEERGATPCAVNEDATNALAAMKLALASLEAEAVCVIDQPNLDYLKSGSDADVWPASRTEMGDVLLYRAAPPAPVSVPDGVTAEDCPAFVKYDVTDVDEAWARGYNACRAAMLQGAEHVTTAYKLSFEQWLSQQTGTIDVECGCVMTEVFFHWLRVAYEAGNSPVIPDGWQLVPKEPTEAMNKAGWAAMNEHDAINPTYRAMLAAAPQQEDK
ncbi:hypothetical protein BEH70_11725 [Citrobacter freundii]|nr:hypothetical protein BEH70_11725 [Citrobacter freundii]